MEEWKDIKDFPGYQVSNKGQVRSFWKKKKKVGTWGGYDRVLSDEPRILLQSDDGNGYMKVFLQNDVKRRCVKVHRLVAEAFIPNDDPKKDTIDHIISGPEGKLDNSVENLRWISRRENIQKAYKDGVCNNRIEKSKRKVIVIDTTTGLKEYYSSVREAALKYNRHYTSFSHALSEGKLIAGKFRVLDQNNDIKEDIAI